MWNSFNTGEYEGMIAETVSIFGHGTPSEAAHKAEVIDGPKIKATLPSPQDGRRGGAAVGPRRRWIA